MLPEYLDIPLFPLPNITFFPRTVLPLHVFEPRYRKLVSNVLNSDRLIGVPLLRPGWQQDYFGRPPICKIFGVGRIVDHSIQENGNYNIVLEGLERVRLCEEYHTEAFRSARVQVMQDPPIDERSREIKNSVREILSLAEEICGLMPQSGDSIRAAMFAHPHPLVAADRLAAALVVDSYERQSILEQLDPARRLRLIAVQLYQIRAQLTGIAAPPEMAEEELE